MDLMEMVLVPAGRFVMGAVDIETEKPVHFLELPAFEIGRYPVTRAAFEPFARSIGLRSAAETSIDRADHPATDLSWYEAKAYCRWLSQRTGRRYDLPSEAEWEKAARGPQGTRYPWGDAWAEGCCNAGARALDTTTPVGLYSPSGDSFYGCADMAGNIWEWTRSTHRIFPYDPSDGREREDASPCEPRVLRGGSFLNEPARCRSSFRLRYGPNYRFRNVGFRVVLRPPRAAD